MKFWIDNEAGEMIECSEVHELKGGKGTLVFESDRRLPAAVVEGLRDCIAEYIGCGIVILPPSVRLVAQVSPRGVVRKIETILDTDAPPLNTQNLRNGDFKE